MVFMYKRLFLFHVFQENYLCICNSILYNFVEKFACFVDLTEFLKQAEFEGNWLSIFGVVSSGIGLLFIHPQGKLFRTLEHCIYASAENLV